MMTSASFSSPRPTTSPPARTTVTSTPGPVVQRAADDSTTTHGEVHNQRAEAQRNAEQVFEHVERLLRADLMIQRERIGRATDLN
jgi:hypothetical protein